MSKHKRGVLSQVRAKIKSGKGGGPTMDYILVILNDPCVYCGEFGSDSIDHITPVAKKHLLNTGHSRNHWTNLTACHRACNSRKGTNGVIKLDKLL